MRFRFFGPLCPSEARETEGTALDSFIVENDSLKRELKMGCETMKLSVDDVTKTNMESAGLTSTKWR